MKIINDIINSIKYDADIEGIMRGLHWTAVISRNFGLASTVINESCLDHDHTENGNKQKGFLSDISALEVARFCYSNNTSEASLGLAAINSLIDINIKKCADVDGLKYIHKIGEGKNISVIGHFPFLENLSSIAKNLWVIEKRPKKGDFPEEKNAEFLPQSDIVVITSTTLINHSIDGILDLCKKGSVKMLLGPSTPMSEVLFDHGIDILSGSFVTGNDIVLKHISEGANFIRIKKSGAVRFVTMLKDGNNIKK
jgi:uncharacterized protein